jgi:hypothetical protein
LKWWYSGKSSFATQFNVVWTVPTCFWCRVFMWILYTSTCFFLNTVKYHIKVLVSFSYQYTFSQMNNSEINHIPISCFFNLSSELSFQNLTSQIRKYDHKSDSDLIKIKSNSPKRYLFKQISFDFLFLKTFTAIRIKCCFYLKHYGLSESG